MGTKVARPVRELAVLLVAAGVYFGARVLVEGAPPTAIRNAERLLDIERWLGLDIEHTLQGWAAHEPIRSIGNLSYVWLHWPLLIVCFVVLLLRDEEAFRRCRNALLISGAVGIIFFALIPMSPPRFLPDYVGTVSEEARRHYLDYPLGWTNRFAAFPSFHAAWTLVACLAVRSTVRNAALRFVLVLPGIIVAVAAITTGNHYVIDSAAGITLVLVAYFLPGHLRDRKRTHANDATAATEMPRTAIASTGTTA